MQHLAEDGAAVLLIFPGMKHVVVPYLVDQGGGDDRFTRVLCTEDQEFAVGLFRVERFAQRPSQASPAAGQLPSNRLQVQLGNRLQTLLRADAPGAMGGHASLDVAVRIARSMMSSLASRERTASAVIPNRPIISASARRGTFFGSTYSVDIGVTTASANAPRLIRSAR